MEPNNNMKKTIIIGAYKKESGARTYLKLEIEVGADVLATKLCIGCKDRNDKKGVVAARIGKSVLKKMWHEISTKQPLTDSSQLVGQEVYLELKESSGENKNFVLIEKVGMKPKRKTKERGW